MLYGRVRRAVNGVLLVFDDFFGKCCWNGLLASYVAVAVVLLANTISKWRNNINVTKSDVFGLMACDGVGVQWQNGDCVGLLWFWRCCAEPLSPFWRHSKVLRSCFACMWIWGFCREFICKSIHYISFGRLVNTVQCTNLIYANGGGFQVSTGIIIILFVLQRDFGT